MFSKKIILLLVLTASVGVFWNCNASKKGGGFNLFSIQDDIALGKQVSQQVGSDPMQFPILPEKGNEEAYKHIRELTTQLLRTGKVAHANEFDWAVKIIKDDKIKKLLK
ncbi:MAG: hypothetical protein HY842_03825 [Bacteroidetes bacterium]|nr:hypothetical protein [Bacteroidota bacterium]